MGEFVMVDNSNSSWGFYTLLREDGIVHKMHHLDGRYDGHTVLPSIASGWWDREIATGLWVRRYELENDRYHLTWRYKDDEHANSAIPHNSTPLMVSIIDAHNIPAVPLTLRKLENNGSISAPPLKTEDAL
jgi:hypothetical protein